MARIKRVEPVMAFCAVISPYDMFLNWSLEKLASLWGAKGLGVASLDVPYEVPFDAAEYYSEEMGEGVRKWLVSAIEPQDPGNLAEWKLASNRWEEEAARLQQWPVKRPLNLDPGYVSQAKLVLATAKDRDHRIYLRNGIFAEVTLRYLRSGWTENSWTYRDYQREEVKRFADVCRKRLREYLIANDSFRT